MDIHVKLTEENYQDLFYTKFGLKADLTETVEAEIEWIEHFFTGKTERCNELCTIGITNVNISGKGIVMVCHIID